MNTMNTRLVNLLTLHPVTLRTAEGDITLPSSGVARLVEDDAAPAASVGLPVPSYYVPTGSALEGLPPPQEGVIYLVSRAVLDAEQTADRTDLASPGTGPKDGALWDADGRLVAVTRLLVHHAPNDQNFHVRVVVSRAHLAPEARVPWIAGKPRRALAGVGDGVRAATDALVAAGWPTGAKAEAILEELARDDHREYVDGWRLGVERLREALRSGEEEGK